jgi:Na+/H+ antiporter NhaC
LLPVVIGAVFAGAIFGDHISPISDTTVMASIFAGSDHIAHVTTQIPHAVVTAAVSGFLYLLSSFIVRFSLHHLLKPDIGHQPLFSPVGDSKTCFITEAMERLLNF